MLNIPDVNVLIALSWKNHIHHHIARTWFADTSNEPFATCSITECGFVRLSMNPLVVGEPVSFAAASQAVQCYHQLPNHRFLPLEHNFTVMTKDFFISGYRQITDAYLLGIAIRTQGRLITFDKRIHEIIAHIPEAKKHLAVLQ